MTITTITLSASAFISYASVAEADIQMLVDPIRGAKWATKTTDQKGACLVAATNRLDLFNFTGTKTDPDQLNQFPRDGETEVPLAVQQATIYLAGSIAINAKAAGVGTSGSNQRRVKAGSAEVEFFKPTRGKPLSDEQAYALLRPYLAGGSVGLSSGLASGTCQPPFDSGYGGLDKGYA